MFRITRASRKAWGVTLGAVLATLATSASASAQNYPTKPMTMIIPFAAGGPQDQIGRVMRGESAFDPSWIKKKRKTPPVRVPQLGFHLKEDVF